MGAKTPAEREEMIKDMDEQMKKLESDFKAFVDDLNKQYKEKSDQKDKDIEAIKNSGLGLLKSEHAYEKKKKQNFKASMHVQLQRHDILNALAVSAFVMAVQNNIM